MSKKVLVIGAGVSGMAVASLLAKEGFDVTVQEKNSHYGGKLESKKVKGFTFDMGPSWYLMPEAFERYFTEFEHKPSDFFKLTRLNPSYRAFFEDGHVDVPSDSKKTAKLFGTFEKGGGEKLEKYLENSKYLYKTAMSEFLYKESSRVTDFFNWKMISNAPKFHLFEKMHSFVGRTFKSERSKNILTYNLVFLGGSPKTTPALYSLMAHVDFNLGAWYPMGGMVKLADAMYEIAQGQGVKFKFNSPVKKIPEDRIVVSTADYAHIQLDVLPSNKRSYDKNYWKSKTIAPGVLLVYLGINKRLKNLKHHNLYFSKDTDAHYSSIFNDKTWPKDPSFYVCAPSVTDSSVAPKGKENLFVLVPIAAGLKDSQSERERLVKQTLLRLEKMTNQKIVKHIVYKEVRGLSDFSKCYNAYKGTAFGLAHTLFQTALFRPSLKDSKIDNLYYAGQYTHPGVGLPTSIISAHIVRDKIIKKYGRQKTI